MMPRYCLWGINGAEYLNPSDRLREVCGLVKQVSIRIGTDQQQYVEPMLKFAASQGITDIALQYSPRGGLPSGRDPDKPPTTAREMEDFGIGWEAEYRSFLSAVKSYGDFIAARGMDYGGCKVTAAAFDAEWCKPVFASSKRAVSLKHNQMIVALEAYFPNAEIIGYRFGTAAHWGGSEISMQRCWRLYQRIATNLRELARAFYGDDLYVNPASAYVGNTLVIGQEWMIDEARQLGQAIAARDWIGTIGIYPDVVGISSKDPSGGRVPLEALRAFVGAMNGENR